MEVDASALGAGAVLLQEDENGIGHPVSYFSQKFKKPPAKLQHHWEGGLGPPIGISALWDLP